MPAVEVQGLRVVVALNRTDELPTLAQTYIRNGEGCCTGRPNESARVPMGSGSGGDRPPTEALA